MKYSNELDKVSYSLGLSIASNLISSGVKTVNAEAFNDAMNTVFSGQMPEIMPDEANNILRTTSTNCKKKKVTKPWKPEKPFSKKTRKKKESLYCQAACNTKS